MRCIVDIETDGFIENLNTIHCIVAKDVDTNEVFSFVQDECYTKFPEFSKKIDKFIMHNGISFDARILNSFNITTITPTKVIDTLLLSQLLYPEGIPSLPGVRDLKVLRGTAKTLNIILLRCWSIVNKMWR